MNLSVRRGILIVSPSSCLLKRASWFKRSSVQEDEASFDKQPISVSFEFDSAQMNELWVLEDEKKMTAAINKIDLFIDNSMYFIVAYVRMSRIYFWDVKISKFQLKDIAWLYLSSTTIG